MYDELIAILDDLHIALDNGFGKASTFIACTKATRKVIELHRPCCNNLNSFHKGYCLICSTTELNAYPCSTIQAIAEELK